MSDEGSRRSDEGREALPGGMGPGPLPLVPRSSSAVRRPSSLVPLLLIAVGVASVIYGARYRLVPVLGKQVEVQVVEQEEEVAIPVPSPFGPVVPEGLAEPDAEGRPPATSEMEAFPGLLEPPSIKVKKITYVPNRVIKEVTDEEPEPVLVWEVTVGGVVRTETGVVMRTYGPTEDGGPARPLSLCPS